MRISFGIYNDEDEIDQCVELLHRIARKEWQAEYVADQETGHFKLKGVEFSFADYMRF